MLAQNGQSESSSGTNCPPIVCAAGHLDSWVSFTMAAFITCSSSARHWALLDGLHWAVHVGSVCSDLGSHSLCPAACIHRAQITACFPPITYALNGRLRNLLSPLLKDLGGVHLYFLRMALVIQRRSCAAAPEWIPEGRWVCCCWWLAADLLMRFMAMLNFIKSAWVAFVHRGCSKIHCAAHFRNPQGNRLCPLGHLSCPRPVAAGLLGPFSTSAAPHSSFSRPGRERFKTSLNF